jgi:hypothetical protein
MAKASSGAEVAISPTMKASLSAEVTQTYQQSFSALTTQMDQFTFEAEKNSESAYEVIWKEYQVNSTVSYTVKKLFSTTTYSVPYTYTLYIPDMEEGGSRRTDTICNGVSKVLHIEAESYANESSHVGIVECSEGGDLLGWINDGEWVSYDHVNFGSGGYATFQARIASDEQGGEIEIRLDDANGQGVGICQIPNTGGWQNWLTITCGLTNDIEGERTIYLLFNGQGEYLYNINWIEFKP